MASKSGRKRRQREERADGPTAPLSARRADVAGVAPITVPPIAATQSVPTQSVAATLVSTPTVAAESVSLVAPSFDLQWHPVSREPERLVPTECLPVVAPPISSPKPKFERVPHVVRSEVTPVVLRSLERLEQRVEAIAVWANKFGAWQVEANAHTARCRVPASRKLRLATVMAFLFLPLLAFMAWQVRSAFSG